MSSATGGPPAASADRRWLVLVLVAVAQLMVVLDSTVVNIALPSAQRALGFPNSDRQWVVTAYALAFGSLLLVGGRSATCTAASGSSSRAWSDSPSRRPSGVPPSPSRCWWRPGRCKARSAPSSRRPPSDPGQHVSGPAERGRAFGVFGSVAAGGGGVGLILGGVLTQYLSWRFTLFVNLIFAADRRAGPGVYAHQRARQSAADGLARGRTGLRRAFPHRLRLLPRRDGRLDGRADDWLPAPGRAALAASSCWRRTVTGCCHCG